MENAMSLITNFPTTKEQQKKFVDKLVAEVESGIYNPLDCELSLKALEEIVKSVREKTKDIIKDEAAKYSKTFNYKGVEITQSQRTTYDYSNCGDNLINDLNSQLTQIKEQIKIREQVLKSGVDIATGETFNPPTTLISSFLTIKFK